MGRISRAVADIDVYDRTPVPLVVERTREADLVITNKVRFPLEVLQQLPRVRYIGVSGTGYDIVDVKAARETGSHGDQHTRLRHGIRRPGEPSRGCCSNSATACNSTAMPPSPENGAAIPTGVIPRLRSSSSPGRRWASSASAALATR